MAIALTALDSRFRFHFAFSCMSTLVCPQHGPILRIITTLKPAGGFEKRSFVEQQQEYECLVASIPVAVVFLMLERTAVT